MSELLTIWDLSSYTNGFDSAEKYRIVVHNKSATYGVPRGICILQLCSRGLEVCRHSKVITPKIATQNLDNFPNTLTVWRTNVSRGRKAADTDWLSCNLRRVLWHAQRFTCARMKTHPPPRATTSRQLVVLGLPASRSQTITSMTCPTRYKSSPTMSRG
jgi:hypothetical protein